MNVWLASMLIALAPAQATTAPATPATQPAANPARGLEVGSYRLAAKTDKPTYQVGEAIELVVTLTNVAATEAQVANAAHPYTYDLEVRVPKVLLKGPRPGPADKAPLTLFGRASGWVIGGDGSNQVNSIPAGGSIEVTYPELNRLYDMTLEGEYEIVVRRRLPGRADPDQQVVATSNTIVLTVGESRRKPQGGESASLTTRPAERR